MDASDEEKQQTGHGQPQVPDGDQTLFNAQNHHQARESGTNWAEFDVNAAPQVAMGDAPEALAPPGGIDIEADLQRRSSSDNKPAPIAIKPWHQNWKIVLSIAVLGLAAIIIPIAVTQSNPGGHGPETPDETPFASASTDATDAHPTASGSARSPGSTSSPIPECNPSDFRTGVNWIGSSIPNWDFKLNLASDAVDCCEQCYEDKGCNGWLYMPNDANGVPPCNRILGHSGPNSDDECPNGKPDIVFARGQNKDDNFGGGGPCAGRVRG